MHSGQITTPNYNEIQNNKMIQESRIFIIDRNLPYDTDPWCFIHGMNQIFWFQCFHNKIDLQLPVKFDSKKYYSFSY